MTSDYHNSCVAARKLKDDLDSEAALNYLVGEKYMRFLRRAASDRERLGDLQAFTAEIVTIFEPDELRAYCRSPQARFAAKQACGEIEDAAVSAAQLRAEAEAMLMDASAKRSAQQSALQQSAGLNEDE